MKLVIHLAILSGLVLFSTASFSSNPQAEISQMLHYFADEWNGGELDSLKSHYHPDFVLISSNSVQTKKQRLDDLEMILAPGKDQGEMSIADIQVEMLGEKHAMAYGRSRLKFKDGTELGSMFSSVYVKTPFGWKAILTHE